MMMKSISIVLLLAGVAHADRTAAEALKDAEKAKKAGKTGEACEAFAEADKLEASDTTKLSLANCYADLGKLGSAWHLYHALGKTDKADKVAKKAPKVAIEITPKSVKPKVFAAGMDMSGAVDEPMPIDSGEVEIAASAPGYQTWREKQSFSDGELTTVKIKLEKQTEVAKIDPNDPDAPEPETVDSVVSTRPRYSPFIHEVSVGGDLGFLFAPQAYRARAKLSYSFKSLIEIGFLAGGRGNFDTYDWEGGAAVDAKGIIPFGNFCRAYAHVEGAYWSRTGGVADVGGGLACRDWRTGNTPQLFVGFDKEIGDGPSWGVMVGVGKALVDKR